MSNDMYDVAIIGGGPAGSTAATLLARAGRRVIVFEREKFPRFHIGESLLPFSIQTFDRLGVREKLDQTFLPKFGGEIMAACGTRGVKFYFKDGFRSERDRAYQVTRSDFDKSVASRPGRRSILSPPNCPRKQCKPTLTPFPFPLFCLRAGKDGAAFEKYLKSDSGRAFVKRHFSSIRVRR
jgi:choline dehydrogenase-like flavoprotein